MTISALIIDDEQLARDELKYLLDSVGGVDVVAQGANGIEAVELIEEHHPDLVFLDVQMPGLDGFAVIQRLMDAASGEAEERGRGREPLPQIVFATAYDQYAVRAFDVNAVDYLLKPFDRARVQQAVERVRGRMARRANGAGRRRRESPIESQLDALLRLLNRPQGASTRGAAGQADCAGAEPAAAGGPGGDLLCGHRRGRDSRGDAAASRGSRSAARWKSCWSCSIRRSSGARIADLW